MLIISLYLDTDLASTMNGQSTLLMNIISQGVKSLVDTLSNPMNLIELLGRSTNAVFNGINKLTNLSQ